MEDVERCSLVRVEWLPWKGLEGDFGCIGKGTLGVLGRGL